MRDLIRSTEGEISAADFSKGAKLLGLLTLGVGAFLMGVRWLSTVMEWMTVAIAPFFGAVVLFAVCSLIYFWYCLFVKRHRALGQSFVLVYAWLFAMFAASALRLLDYQNRTLSLAESGLITWAGFGALVLSILSVGLFVLLLVRSWQADTV